MNIHVTQRRCRGTVSLILGAMDADMAPPRTNFDRLMEGLRPVGQTSNPLNESPAPPLSAALFLAAAAIFLLLGATAWAGPRTTVYDTVTPVAIEGKIDIGAATASWKPVDAAGHAFAGDAALLNKNFTAIVRRDGGGVELYPAGTDGHHHRGRLVPVAGGTAKTFSGLKSVADKEAGVAVEASVDGGSVIFSIEKRRMPAVTAQTKGGVDALRFAVPCRLGVLPDFHADDMMIDARRIPIDKADIPADNLFLFLAGSGASIVGAVWEKSGEDLKIAFEGEGDSRSIKSADVFFSGGRVHAAVLEGKGIWYSRNYTADEIRKGGPMDWRVPFIAKWKANFTREDGTISSRQILYRKNWDDGRVDSLEKGKDGFVAVLEKITGRSSRFNKDLYVVPNGIMAAYPMGTDDETPTGVFCVADLLRLLNTEVCAYVLDLDARKGDDKGIFTCAYNVVLPTIMPTEYPRNIRAVAGFIKDERVFIRKYSEQVVVFIKHIQDRINSYVTFRKEMLVYLDEQEKKKPELADFIGRLRAQLTKKIPVFVRYVDPLKEADGVARATPLLAEREKAILVDLPDQAARAVGIGPGIKHIGDPQDTRVQNERQNALIVRTMASMEMAVNPAATEIAKEVRRRSREVLRGGAAHEKPVTW